MKAETPAPRRVRVCHLSLGLCTGGMERLLVEFARQHDPELFELHFVALHQVGQPADDIRQTGCQVHLLQDQRGKPLQQFRVLTSWLQKWRPDVLHTHNAYPHFHGTLAGRWNRVPVIVNTRHGRRIGTTASARWLFWLGGMLADRVVAVSDDAARLCLSDTSLPADKVTRIWNGIDLDRFRFQGPRPGCRAISVARLSQEKDFPTLIRAVAQAREVVPELSLRIVGDGPVRGELESLIRELGQESAIELLGERQDVPDLLAESSFFATSTLTEGISLTLLEAMASGLPILATNVGGNPEVVDDGITGSLVPASDVNVMTAALIRYCHSQGLWELWGRAGRDRVTQHFNVQSMVASYESLYRSLLARKGAWPAGLRKSHADQESESSLTATAAY